LNNLSILKSNIAKRIWDSFLIDGEIYAIRTGLGILKYFELELKLSTFNETINILLQKQEIDEDCLLNTVESVQVFVFK